MRSRECLAQLGFLVLHAAGQLRLVLSARADPALPLHVLRVRGRLVEIRAADLAFTEAEAAELLAAHGLDAAARAGGRAVRAHRGLGRRACGSPR